jgi:ribosome-associated toxin RatA of RatAB toxin-antitoxin module
MGTLTAERTVDVDAPVARCYAIAADLEKSPEWQRALQSVEVLERDGQGRPAVVETVSDASVKTVKSRLAFTYDEPSAIHITQQKGELKSLHGGWSFADLGEGRTRVTYALEVDPGRMLGLLLRGPVVDKVRQVLVGDAVDALKVQAESA